MEKAGKQLVESNAGWDKSVKINLELEEPPEKKLIQFAVD